MYILLELAMSHLPGQTYQGLHPALPLFLGRIGELTSLSLNLFVGEMGLIMKSTS